mmetsp:Transcript_4270/g.9672  ORF Transcript_4270/g.9672 Transcript_4270/m.9672 type:complete len:324 (-) Transcript_4270:347-1318(-)
MQAHPPPCEAYERCSWASETQGCVRLRRGLYTSGTLLSTALSAISNECQSMSGCGRSQAAPPSTSSRRPLISADVSALSSSKSSNLFEVPNSRRRCSGAAYTSHGLRRGAHTSAASPERSSRTSRSSSRVWSTEFQYSVTCLHHSNRASPQTHPLAPSRPSKQRRQRQPPNAQPLTQRTFTAIHIPTCATSPSITRTLRTDLACSRFTHRCFVSTEADHDPHWQRLQRLHGLGNIAICCSAIRGNHEDTPLIASAKRRGEPLDLLDYLLDAVAEWRPARWTGRCERLQRCRLVVDLFLAAAQRQHLGCTVARMVKQMELRFGA